MAPPPNRSEAPEVSTEEDEALDVSSPMAEVPTYPTHNFHNHPNVLEQVKHTTPTTTEALELSEWNCRSKIRLPPRYESFGPRLVLSSTPLEENVAMVLASSVLQKQPSSQLLG